MDGSFPKHVVSVADALTDAVREVLPLSPRAAVRLASKALDLVDPADPAFVTNLLALVDTHLTSGGLATAAALLHKCLLRPLPQDVAARLRSSFVHVQVAAGRAGTAVPVAEDAVIQAGPNPARSDDASADLLFALSLHDPARAGMAATRCLAGEPRSGSVRAVAGSTLADLAWQGGEAERAMSLAARAVADADQEGGPAWRLIVKLGYARKLLGAGRYAEAGRCLQRAAGELVKPGTPGFYGPALAIARAELLMRTGDPAKAQELARSALAAAREAEAGLFSPLAHTVLAAACLRIGDLEASQRHLDMSDGLLSTSAQRLWPVHNDWIRVRLTAERRGPRDARRLVATEYPDLATRKALLLDEPGVPAWLARLGATAGDDRLADEAMAAMETLARRNPRVHRLTVAAHHAKGVRENSLDALRQAAAEHPDRWDRAHALEDLGTCLAGPRNRDFGEAVRQFQTSLRLFEQLGTARDGERLSGRLRDLGVQPIQTRHAHLSWSELSEMEARIVRLVTQGLTNHQIARRVSLSAHTVNYHLRKVFRKVGVNSRIELVRLVSDARAIADPLPVQVVDESTTAAGQ